MPAPVIEYAGSHHFPVSTAELWRVLQRTDRFTSWWGWLKEFDSVGQGIAEGSFLRGVVAPPVPYRMRVEIEIVRCSPPTTVDALVRGDLNGEAHLSIRPSHAGSTVDVNWTVEMMQPPMRLACRFAYPIMRWGHDRVVDMTVSSFRRNLESEHLEVGGN